MLKRIMTLALAAALPLTLAVGCAQAPGNSAPASDGQASTTETSGEPVEIDLWYTANESDPNDRDHAWMSENVELFEASHENIKVNVTIIGGAGGGDYRTKLIAEIAADNAPDVFMTWGWGRLVPFAESGKLYDLTDLIETDPELSQVVNKDNLGGVTYNGRYYGLPDAVDLHGLFYNKKIFAECGVEPPTTVEELLEVSKVFREKGLVPVSFGNSVTWAIAIPYSTLLADIAGDDFTASMWASGPEDFTAPPFLQAMDEVNKIVDADVFTENFNGIEVAESVAAFKEGKAAMLMQGSWQAAALNAALGDDVGFISFPTLSGKQVVNKAIPKAYAISANTEHPEEALEFLKFIFSPERQQAFSEKGAFVATKNVGIDESGLNSVSRDIMAILDQQDVSYTYLYSIACTDNLTTESQKVIQACTEGADVQESFANLQKFKEQFE